MTETEKKFDAIRRTYPETISKDQFYRIAHISKATALHLLQNGLVPCKDSGKKTRRYTIRTDDVITYLIDREIQPEKYGAPDHWYRDRSGYRKSRNTFRYDEQPRVGQHRNELPQGSFRPGIPRLPHHDLRRHLCRSHQQHDHRGQHSLGSVLGGCIHSYPVLLAVQNRQSLEVVVQRALRRSAE